VTFNRPTREVEACDAVVERDCGLQGEDPAAFSGARLRTAATAATRPRDASNSITSSNDLRQLEIANVCFVKLEPTANPFPLNDAAI